MLAAARGMELEPELHAIVIRLQHAGWEIVIASAGCEWYIRRLLAEQGVAVTFMPIPANSIRRAG